MQVADTALNRINVRRLLLQTRKLISAVAIRLLFEQNDDIVRNQFLSLVNPILDGIRSERGLTDFRVTVDSSPESIDRNELIGKIFIKPTRSLEYIDISFTIFPISDSTFLYSIVTSIIICQFIHYRLSQITTAES